jgi:signal transduction histidine kinase
MIKPLKTQLLLVMLLMTGTFTFGQDVTVDLDWYKNFFDQPKKVHVETELVQLKANLQRAEETNDLKAQARILTEMGIVHLVRTRDYEQAMEVLVQAMSIEDSLNLSEQRTFTSLAIAQLFEAVGDYDEAAKFLDEAVKSNEKSAHADVLVYILNKQGRVNVLRGLPDNAFDNYEMALKYKDSIDDQLTESETLFNLAHLHSHQGKYEDALKVHKDALAIRRAKRNRLLEAQSLHDIAEVYRLLKNDEKALANHTLALKIRLNLKEKAPLAESYNSIGNLYHSQNNHQRAISNLLLALDAAQDSQDQNQIRRSYELLSQSYKAAGDYKNAHKYEELYQAIHDFIQTDQSERKLIATQNKYVIGKKETQIGKLETEGKEKEKVIEEQKKFRNVLIALIAATLIIVALILYLYIDKRKTNKQLQEANDKVSRQNVQLQQLNSTKDKFFSILGHDLKGPLNSLTSFSGLLINHTDSLSKDEIKMLAKDLDKSLKNLFALLENLLEWSRSQTGNIEFKPEPFDLHTLLDQNVELLKTQAQNKNIVLSDVSRAGIEIRAHKHSINTVIRNLVSNAIKFTPEGGAVTVNAQLGQDEVMVSVSDTGVGMSEDVIAKLFRIDAKHSTKGTADEKGTGLGLILCKEFVEKNGGRIGVQSEVGQGSVFYFTLPVKQNAQDSPQTH